MLIRVVPPSVNGHDGVEQVHEAQNQNCVHESEVARQLWLSSDFST